MFYYVLPIYSYVVPRFLRLPPSAPLQGPPRDQTLKIEAPYEIYTEGVFFSTSYVNYKCFIYSVYLALYCVYTSYPSVIHTHDILPCSISCIHITLGQLVYVLWIVVSNTIREALYCIYKI